MTSQERICASAGHKEQRWLERSAWAALGEQVAQWQAVLQRMEKNGVCCKVKLDRIQVEYTEDPRPALRSLADYRPGRSVFPRHHNDRDPVYGYAQWFADESAGVKVNAEGQPLRPFISPWRLTVYGSDSTGLTWRQVAEILVVIPNFKLTLVEVAFDFGIDFADRVALRHSVLFGKSRPCGKCGDTRYWGAWKGIKYVRLYWKPEVGRFRIELELHSRFLRHYDVNDMFDFRKLARLLADKHIFFAQLDVGKLRAYVRRRENDRRDRQRIAEELMRFNSNLFSLLYGLRLEVGIANARRMLAQLWLNRVVRDALSEWAERWPTRMLCQRTK